jgi:hypothetical protein
MLMQFFSADSKAATSACFDTYTHFWGENLFGILFAHFENFKSKSARNGKKTGIFLKTCVKLAIFSLLCLDCGNVTIDGTPCQYLLI